jgi:hypothetical protein
VPQASDAIKPSSCKDPIDSLNAPGTLAAMAKEPAKSAKRAERLARALKANLARRKAQKRARTDEPAGKEPSQSPKAD